MIMANIEVSDLTGLSKPLTKLIEVVSKGCGNLYKPRAIRKEAEAKAQEIILLGEAEIALEKKRLMAQSEITNYPVDFEPNVLDRAKSRVAHQEISRQNNIEAIADLAYETMPTEVAEEPPAEDWITRFFGLSQDVSDPKMQELWGKILSGEVASPNSFSYRSLNVLSNLTQVEAENFRLFCQLSFNNNMVIKLGHDYKFLSQHGLSYGVILSLRDSGLIHENDHLQNVHQSLPKDENNNFVLHIKNNGRQLQLSHATLSRFSFPIYGFTAAGKELARLIPDSTNFDYLNEFVKQYRAQGFIIKELKEVSPNVFSFMEYSIT